MKDLIQVALSQVGIKEIPGKDDNPEVLKYFDEIGFSKLHLKDETAWCSAALIWCCLRSGYEKSCKLDARSWMDIGIEVLEPVVGDIVVFWRISKEDWRGHVGIFCRKDNKKVWCLGGNQGNQFCIKTYPINSTKYGVLGYRRLRKLSELYNTDDVDI